jgi:putative NADH-flavin reductase
MKVLVIGAAGKGGEALVNEALVAGHKVTAFVRGAAQYKKANVRVVAGDVLDAAAVGSREDQPPLSSRRSDRLCKGL